MIFAKNEMANQELLKGFKNRTFEKYYNATLYGHLKKDKEVLTAYLKKNKEDSLVSIFDKKVEGSVKIITEYKVLKKLVEKDIPITEVEILLHTGKTHQIRAHFAHIGHFVIGDGKYGKGEINKILKKTKQELTASRLTLHFESESPLYYLDNKTFEL